MVSEGEPASMYMGEKPRLRGLTALAQARTVEGPTLVQSERSIVPASVAGVPVNFVPPTYWPVTPLRSLSCRTCWEPPLDTSPSMNKAMPDE